MDLHFPVDTPEFLFQSEALVRRRKKIKFRKNKERKRIFMWDEETWRENQAESQAAEHRGRKTMLASDGDERVAGKRGWWRWWGRGNLRNKEKGLRLCSEWKEPKEAKFFGAGPRGIFFRASSRREKNTTRFGGTVSFFVCFSPLNPDRPPVSREYKSSRDVPVGTEPFIIFPSALPPPGVPAQQDTNLWRKLF